MAEAVVREGVERAEELDAWHWDFVNIQADRLGKYGEGTRMSERELEILRRLGQRLGVETGDDAELPPERPGPLFRRGG